jgi:hypothetical protein
LVPKHVKLKHYQQNHLYHKEHQAKKHVTKIHQESMIAWFVEKFRILTQFSPFGSVAPWTLPMFSVGVLGAL